ncbi:MAG: hypothetical protein ACXITV_01785 [Luteibaculaceae bacterium]
MKNTVILSAALALLSFTGQTLHGQENTEAKTMFTTGKPLGFNDVGFFVSPNVALTQLDGSSTYLLNLRGGFTLRDKVSFGAFFNYPVNQVVPQSETLSNVYLDYWTTGGFVEYTVLSKKMVHLTFPLYIGYGEMEMDSNAMDVELGEASFFTVEPSALLEVNLTKNIRFNLGAGYRIASPVEYRNFNQSDISGLTAYVGLKFGLFR